MKGSKFQQRTYQNPISTHILTKMDTVCSRGNFLTPNSHLTMHHKQIYRDRDTRIHTLESNVQRMSECSTNAVLVLQRVSSQPEEPVCSKLKQDNSGPQNP